MGSITRLGEHGGGGATQPNPTEGAQRNYAETPQSGHAPGSGPNVENRESGGKNRFVQRQCNWEEKLGERRGRN